METEPNSKTNQSSVINDTLLNSEFIGYINTLSQAILEFYKVSKNINLNKELLINYGKKEINNENILNDNTINNNNIENNKNINFIELIKTLAEIFNELEYNNTSQQKNLSNFFEDSKILFKKLREKRKEIIIESKTRTHTQVSTSSRNSLERGKGIYDENQNEEFLKSYSNRIINDKNQKKVVSNSCKKRSNTNKSEIGKKNVIIKGKNLNRNNKLINEEYFTEPDNILNSVSEYGVKNPIGNIIHISSNELSRLRSINKRLSSELRKYKSKTVDKIEGINNQNNNNFNNFEKINIYIKDKDKIISTLKKEMNQSSQNYKVVINKYKNEIMKLKKENSNLKKNNNSASYNKNELDKSMMSRLSNLIKENRQLKDNLEEIKMANLQSEFNTKVVKSLYFPESNESKENQYLRKKIKVYEDKFQQKQTEIKDLNYKIMLLKKRYEDEKLNLNKKYSEISVNLMNKEKEIMNLQKQYYSNNNTLKNVKQKLNVNINENNDINFQEIKDEYEKKLAIFNNKIIELESNLEKNKKLKLEQNQQLTILNKQIKEKDSKLLQQNYQIEQIKSNLSSQKMENQRLLKQIQDLNIIQQNNENINNLNEKLEEQQNLNNDLNDEISKIKNDNELLKNKILSNEKKISQLNEFENLKKTKEKELDNLKNEIQSLKFENEKLNFVIKHLKEEGLGNNLKKMKKQTQEIEGLKQTIQKLQQEREKGDSELNTLKRENEKIKNQIVRLSKTLPEEYSDLQKQFKDLETKYIALKNKNPNSQTPKKNKNEENQEDKFNKELTEAKKEIEQLKKKNVELVTQLEDKEINKNYYDNRSEDANKSNYEEEFDLRKMAKGARDKNRSQDINIDYPGIQTYKEKVRELEFYYNSLENLVKKLLLTIQCNPKNKTYVAELCRIVGFDLETTNKILTNKNKNFILGLFSKQ